MRRRLAIARQLPGIGCLLQLVETLPGNATCWQRADHAARSWTISNGTGQYGGPRQQLLLVPRRSWEHRLFDCSDAPFRQSQTCALSSLHQA
jgi:hypothetical protein